MNHNGRFCVYTCGLLLFEVSALHSEELDRARRRNLSLVSCERNPTEMQAAQFQL